MKRTTPKRPPDDVLEFFRTTLEYNTEDGGIRNKVTKEALGWNSQGYVRWAYKDVRYLVHHITWFLCKGEWPIHPLDHKDRNGWNNKIENLNYTDHVHNARNSNLSVRNKTGYKGVYKAREHRYRAVITVNKKQIVLGTFYTAEEANEARKTAENKFWNSTFAY